MNIFYTSNNPRTAAAYLDNKRVVKMVLETAQLLSTAIHHHGIELDVYRPTHKNHPCAVWACSTGGNYQWLLEHFVGLLEQYTLRYNKVHKSSQLLTLFIEAQKYMPQGEFTTPPNCAANKSLGVDFKHIADTTQAYKDYLAVRWYNDKRKPIWG